MYMNMYGCYQAVLLRMSIRYIMKETEYGCIKRFEISVIQWSVSYANFRIKKVV